MDRQRERHMVRYLDGRSGCGISTKTQKKKCWRSENLGEKECACVWDWGVLVCTRLVWPFVGGGGFALLN